jgi:hypothetical protein
MVGKSHQPISCANLEPPLVQKPRVSAIVREDMKQFKNMQTILTPTKLGGFCRPFSKTFSQFG